MNLPTTSLAIDRAQPGDAAAIAALLREAMLPHEDFAPHLSHFFVAREGGRIVGAVGAELAGADALLRSLVVAPDQRGKGLGGSLVAALEDAAAGWGVERWWLLTTTAETFFAQRGFRVATRCEAPAGIKETRQFSGGCSGAAVCMTRELQGRASA